MSFLLDDVLFATPGKVENLSDNERLKGPVLTKVFDGSPAPSRGELAKYARRMGYEVVLCGESRVVNGRAQEIVVQFYKYI